VGVAIADPFTDFGWWEDSATVEAATRIALGDFVTMPYRMSMGVYVCAITHGGFGSANGGGNGAAAKKL
jgi:hypothetical protein